MTETLRLDAHWLGEPREYAIDENEVVYIKVGETKWWIDRAETARRKAMNQRATSGKPVTSGADEIGGLRPTEGRESRA